MRHQAMIVMHIVMIALYVLLLRAEKHASYLEGRASVYAEFAEDGTEGTCLTPGGCNELSKPSHSKGHTNSQKSKEPSQHRVH